MNCHPGCNPSSGCNRKGYTMTALMESVFGALELPSSAVSSLAGSCHALHWRASASSPGAQPTHYPLSSAVHSRHRSGPPLRLARRLAKPLLVSCGGGFALRAYWFGLHAPSSRRGKGCLRPPACTPSAPLPFDGLTRAGRHGISLETREKHRGK